MLGYIHVVVSLNVQLSSLGLLNMPYIMKRTSLVTKMISKTLGYASRSRNWFFFCL